MATRSLYVPTTRRSPPARPTLTTAQALGVTVELGGLLAICTVAGLLAGQWLDSQLGTGFLFMLVGTAVGLATAGLGTLRQYRLALRQRAADLAATQAAAEAGPPTDGLPGGA